MRFDLCLYSSMYICVISMYMCAVRFMSVQFDSYMTIYVELDVYKCGSIYVSLVSIGIFVISMYMYAVRFMFARFDVYMRNFDVYVCG